MLPAAEADHFETCWLRMRRNYGADISGTPDAMGVLSRVRSEDRDGKGQPSRFLGVSAAELAEPIRPMRWLVRVCLTGPVSSRSSVGKRIDCDADCEPSWRARGRT